MTMEARMRQLLFTTPMVQATLDDRKTHTRRVVKPQPPKENGMVNAAYCGDQNLWLPTGDFTRGFQSRRYRCPYGVPGDVLWVRESFLPLKQSVQCKSADATYVCYRDGDQLHKSGGYNSWDLERMGRAPIWRSDLKFRPSIHMPFWACRIFLRVTDVRVERVQEISQNDAMDEGVLTFSKEWVHAAFPDYAESYKTWAAIRVDEHGFHKTKPPLGPSPRQRLTVLWNSINAKRGYGWEANPWVWVVCFERIAKEEAARLAPGDWRRLMKGAETTPELNSQLATTR